MNINNKIVSIIIPFYGQTEIDLALPLSSINEQKGVDFSKIDIHLINDGGEPIDMKNLDSFKNLDLHYHELKENIGPGMARQYGIDHSIGEYLMFVDSDDELYETNSLSRFIKVIEETGNHQLIVSNHLEETKNLNHYIVNQFSETNVLYAKFFQRSYLEAMKLTFRPELRMFEDTYFVGTALILADEVWTIMEGVTYVYHWRNNSMIHIENKEKVRQLPNLVLSSKLKLRKVRENKPAILEWLLNSTIAVLYFYPKLYDVDKKEFNKEMSELLLEFSDIYKGYSEKIQFFANYLSENDADYKGMNTTGLKSFLEQFK